MRIKFDSELQKTDYRTIEELRKESKSTLKAIEELNETKLHVKSCSKKREKLVLLWIKLYQTL